MDQIVRIAESIQRAIEIIADGVRIARDVDRSACVSFSFGVVDRTVFDAIVALGGKPDVSLHRGPDGRGVIAIDTIGVIRNGVEVRAQLHHRPATPNELAIGNVYCGARYEKAAPPSGGTSDAPPAELP